MRGPGFCTEVVCRRLRGRVPKYAHRDLEKLFGLPACVDVAVDVVVMWLVRDFHCTVVFGPPPVFAVWDLIVTIGACLNDGEHVRRIWEVDWAIK